MIASALPLDDDTVFAELNAMDRRLWQGAADELVPPKWGQELARRIPNARLELFAGEGHFLGYRHQTEVLRDFVGR